MKTLRIAITGATGLLGRNLLFEIIKQNLKRLDELEIIVLGRAHDKDSLKERLSEIIRDDGCYYIGVDPADGAMLERISKCVMPMRFDLSKPDLDISDEDLKSLASQPIDHFFHVAALTSFRIDRFIERNLNRINVEGTKNLCALIGQLKVGCAVYVGSAYSCGEKKGVVAPDHADLSAKFRNPYERSKLEGELYFREYLEKLNIRVRVFRPTGVCGRLLEEKIGSVCKYDIFYGWAAFFLKQKMKQIGVIDNVYKLPLEMPIRIRVNLSSGMNLVPSDYAAKIMYAVCINDDPGQSYHLANEKDISHPESIGAMLSCLNISGFELVENEPADKNAFEKLYYKTAGQVFTPYAIMGPTIFNTGNLTAVKAKTGLICPKTDGENFSKLLNYAKKHHFGLVPAEQERKVRGR